MTLIGKIKPLKRGGKEERRKSYRGSTRMNADRKTKTLYHRGHEGARREELRRLLKLPKSPELPKLKSKSKNLTTDKHGLTRIGKPEILTTD